MADRPGGSRGRARRMDPLWTEWRGVWSDMFFPMNQETAERWQSTYLEPSIPDLSERQLIEMIPLMKNEWQKQKNPKPDDLILFIQRELRRELLEGITRSCPHCIAGWCSAREYTDGMGGRHMWWCDPPPGEDMNGVWMYPDVQIQCQCEAGIARMMIAKQKDQGLDIERLKRRARKVCRWHLTLNHEQRWHYMPGYRDAVIADRERNHARRSSNG